jgi:hypothetical protein
MRRVIGLCGLVAFTVIAIAAAPSQAALPEFGRCVKATGKTGEFRNAACTAPSTTRKGTYNWLAGPGAKKKFSGTGEGTALETTSKRKITCGGSTFDGEYTGPKTETVTVVLIGCTENTTKKPCESNPAREGEIEPPAALEGEIGFIKGGTTPTVGLDLKRQPTFMAFECGRVGEANTGVVVEGSVIGAVPASPTSNFDKMSEEMIVKYKATSGKQVPEKFEGGPADTLTATFVSGQGKTVEAMALLGTVSASGEEPLEIKAK